ncbi:MAG: efflux RND transporter permease subunit [Terriglobales bacterium]
MLNAIIRWSLHNRAVVVALALVLLVWGGVQALHAPVDVLPQFSPAQVVIQTEAPGFAPPQVEQQVTIPLETSMLGLNGVEDVRSTSIDGLSIITVYFNSGSSVWTDRQLVAEALTTVATLPSSVQPPRLTPVTSPIGMTEVLGMTDDAAGTHPYRLRTLADWLVRRRLLAVPGVANVTVYGGEIKQYQITVDPRRLQQFGLSLVQILQAARDAGALGGGFFSTPSQQIIVHASGQIEDLDSLSRTGVAIAHGVPITLGQVATIHFGEPPPIGGATLNGRPGVVLQVFKQPWADTIPLTAAIDRAVHDLQPSLPAGIRLIPDLFRQARFVQASIHELNTAILEGGLLLVLVLVVFLRNGRAAAISFTAIPLSLLTAVLVLIHGGASLNAMTLGGLLLALGEVVDDAIIDVENIGRRLRENQIAARPAPLWEVVFHASTEVRGSVVYATLIVVLVFLPVLALPGVEGHIFAPLAKSYILAILASLAVALTVTPVLSFWWLPRRTTVVAEADGRLVRSLKNNYEGILRRTLPYPRVLAVAALLGSGIALVTLSHLGGEFLPPFQESNLILHMTSLPGISLSTTLAEGQRLEKELLRLPGVASVDQRAGRASLGEDTVSSNNSEFDLNLRSGFDRQRTLAQIHRVTQTFPAFVWAAKGFISERMDEVLAGSTGTVAIKIYGGDLDQLQQIAAQVQAQLATLPGVRDLQMAQASNVPELDIHLRRAAAAAYGISSADLASTVQMAFYGSTVGTVFEGQRHFDLVVRFPEDSVASPAMAATLLVGSPGQSPVPLASVADVHMTEGPQQITRENGSRVVVVQCNVNGRDLVGFVNRARARIGTHVHPPNGYTIEYAGAYQSRAEATTRLRTLSLAALAAGVFLLYLAFRSVRATALVLFNIPVAFLGGVAAVWVSSSPVSVGTLVGLITLLGITARNGIMMVSHYHHLEEREGEEFGPQLVLRGARERLVPILMTATATGLALLPILVGGQHSGREMELPMAIVIVGGLITSTLLNLLILPTLYLQWGRAPSSAR